MKRLVYILFILLLPGFWSPDILSQDETHVITRRIEQEYEVEEGGRLNIDAERGIIRINAWQKPKVKVIIRIVSKNHNKEQARKDVGHMHYTLNQQRNSISLKNYLVMPNMKSAADLSSILRVEYEIWMPDGLSIDIQNSFGSVTIRNLSAEMNVSLEYSDLSLHNVVGEAEININIGDLICMHSSLDAVIETRYSAVNFNNVNGVIKLNMQSGNINFRLNPEIRLDIMASKTDILLVNRECFEYGFLINTNYTAIRYDAECYFPASKQLNYESETILDRSNWELDYKSKESGDTPIKLSTSYGSINLN